MKLITCVLALAGLAQALSKDELNKHLMNCWRYFGSGSAKAAKYHGCFIPDAQFMLNGEPDPAPWDELEFVEEYFKQVQYATPKVLNPPILWADNELAIFTEGSVTVLATKEEVKLGPQLYKITFNEQGKITKQSIICDSVPLEALSERLSAVTFDPRTQLEAFFNGMRSADVAKTMSFFAPGFSISRNGQADTTDWNEKAFVEAMFKEWAFKSIVIDSFGLTGPRVAHAQISWTITDKEVGGDLAFVEGWGVTFAVDGTLLRVESIVDTRAIFAFYNPMGEALKEIAERKMKERQRAGPPGGPPGAQQ